MKIKRRSANAPENGTPSIGSTLLNNFQFGVFGVNKCDSEDDTFYCNFSRVFNIIMMILVLIAIGYVIYTFLHLSNYKMPKWKKK